MFLLHFLYLKWKNTLVCLTKMFLQVTGLVYWMFAWCSFKNRVVFALFVLWIKFGVFADKKLSSRSRLLLQPPVKWNKSAAAAVVWVTRLWTEVWWSRTAPCRSPCLWSWIWWSQCCKRSPPGCTDNLRQRQKQGGGLQIRLKVPQPTYNIMCFSFSWLCIRGYGNNWC